MNDFTTKPENPIGSGTAGFASMDPRDDNPVPTQAAETIDAVGEVTADQAIAAGEGSADIAYAADDEPEDDIFEEEGPEEDFDEVAEPDPAVIAQAEADTKSAEARIKEAELAKQQLDQVAAADQEHIRLKCLSIAAQNNEGRSTDADDLISEASMYYDYATQGI